MKFSFIPAVIISSAIVLQGCAIDKKYHGYHEDKVSIQGMFLTKYEGGYSDRKISDSHYEISYRAFYGTHEDSIDLALIRSSQIAIENNKKYFSVLPKKIEANSLSINRNNYKTDIKYTLIINLLDNDKRTEEITFNTSEICQILVKKRNLNHDPLPSDIDCGKEISMNLAEISEKKLSKLYKTIVTKYN